MKRFLSVFLLVGGLLGAGGANATPVTWQINKTWTSNDTAVGSFVYDADTNTYSNINVVLTAAGQPGSPNTLTQSTTSSDSQFTFAQSIAINSPAIKFAGFSSQLSNLGGTITGTASSAGSCFDGSCNALLPINNDAFESFTLVGTPTPTAKAVPSLSEWTLMLLGLMVISMLGWHFHRERSY